MKRQKLTWELRNVCNLFYLSLQNVYRELPFCQKTNLSFNTKLTQKEAYKAASLQRTKPSFILIVVGTRKRIYKRQLINNSLLDRATSSIIAQCIVTRSWALFHVNDKETHYPFNFLKLPLGTIFPEQTRIHNKSVFKLWFDS